MSLISVQRSPTPIEEIANNNNNDYANYSSDSETQIRKNPTDENKKRKIITWATIKDGESEDLRTSSSGQKSRSLSECYFTVRGAAVILSHPDQASTSSLQQQQGDSNARPDSEGIQTHLRSMLNIIRPEDSLTMAVRLQSSLAPQHIRYLAVLSTTLDATESHEAAMLGFDFVGDGSKSSIGIAVPINTSSNIRLDGDGGIKVEDPSSSKYLFKPVSIQSMWSLYQCLHKERNIVSEHCKSSHFSGHRWLDYYKGHCASDDALCGQWQFVEDDSAESDLKAKPSSSSLLATLNKSREQIETEAQIKAALKHIMQSVDLDDVTSQDIRRRLSERISVDLKRYKEFIDHEMLVILGQLDKPSKIFKYLYLGTEWNASNWEELKKNGVEYILNVTKEVDNFFPTQFKYLKIWVSDEATTELLMHWQRTYEFVKEAKEKGSKVLVHCKKGISRSASTVVAYTMKEYNWSIESALEHVKRKRNCITPNHGFMEQLQTFHGMLQASNNRHSAVFNLPRGHQHRQSVRSTASAGGGGSVAGVGVASRLQQQDTEDAVIAGDTEPLLHTELKNGPLTLSLGIGGKSATTARRAGGASTAKSPRKTSIQLMSQLFSSAHPGRHHHHIDKRRSSYPDHSGGSTRLCWNSGRVKQRRECFERQHSNKSTKQLVTSIARKIGHLSLYGRFGGGNKDSGVAGGCAAGAASADAALLYVNGRNWLMSRQCATAATTASASLVNADVVAGTVTGGNGGSTNVRSLVIAFEQRK